MRSKSKFPRSTAKKQIVILDDHPMMRQGLAQLISNEPDLAICGEAGTARELMVLLENTRPDLALVDISLPDKNGLEVIKDIQALHPALPVLVISMHDETLYAERVLRAGSRGYIMKHEGGARLMAAIRHVLDGKVYVSDRISTKLLESLSARPAAADASASPSMEKLSDREFEILQLVGQGKGTREIAELLHVSGKTVEAHRANIKRKLNLKTGPELVRYAVRWVEAQHA